MSRLIGAPELRARLKAIQQVFKPIGREWADEAVQIAKATGPWTDRTGTLRRSIRRRNATQRKATVVANYTQYFIDKGTKEHDVAPKRGTVLKWNPTTGGTVFAKRAHIPRHAARPFRERVAREALRRKPMASSVIQAWNDAGGRGGLR
jgi:hypothetical protein